MPPTNASSSSTTTSFSWWQWNGRSRASSATRIRVPEARLRIASRTSPRSGWKSGSGEPAHASTRTSTRSAAAARSSRSETPRRSSWKDGSKCQPARCTLSAADSIAATTRGNAAAPSTWIATSFPSRGGGSPPAHPPGGASSASSRPSLRRRRRWCATTSRSRPSPTLRSSRSSKLLAEQVAVGGHDDVPCLPVAGGRHASDDGDRDPVQLSHRELRGGGELVGDRDHRRVQLVARRVALALEVAQHLDARGADRDVGGALPEGPSERVGDDDADDATGAVAKRVAQHPRRRV